MDCQHNALFIMCTALKKEVENLTKKLSESFSYPNKALEIIPIVFW